MKTSSHPLRPIYWSFGMMIFFMTLLFGTGVFYQSILGKIQAHLAAGPSITDLDTRLSKNIGQPYDRKLHDQLIGAIDSSQSGVTNILQASHTLSKIVLRVAGATTLVALWTVFLLVRKSHDLTKRPSTSDESSAPGA